MAGEQVAPAASAEGRVRRPALLVVGVALAVLTLVAIVVAAVWAATTT